MRSKRTSSNGSSRLLSLCALLLLAYDGLARPRVSVSVDVRLPYTKRWSDHGQLAPLQSHIAATAVRYLEQFRYLEWSRDGGGQARLHIVAEPDPGARGAKPWVLTIRRVDVATALPLPLASALQVQQIPRDEQLSADHVARWAETALRSLENDEGAKHVLSTLLVRIPIANKVDPNLPNVFVNVPATELHVDPDRRTRFDATLLVTRNRPVPLQYPMTLGYVGVPVAPAFRSTHTECSIVAPTSGYRSFVEAASSATIAISEYYPNWAMLRSGNTTRQRKQ